MPYYSDDTLEEVRRGNDIVEVVSSYVLLRSRGGRLWGLCPFHREKSASFTVRAETQTFHCFGCGAGGNVISFVMRYENLGFVDAVKRLAGRARIDLPEEKGNRDTGLSQLRERIYDANAKTARFYFDCLKSAEGKRARDYLARRRLAPTTVAKFGLGYAPEGWDSLYKHLKAQGADDDTMERADLVRRNNKGVTDRFRRRLMFPIIDAGGRVLGFGGRSLGDGEPKYLNTSATPVFSKNHVLFAVNFARKAKDSDVVIVEGFMDAIALFQAGFQGAMATQGTAMGVEHARLLNRYFRGRTVVLILDSDAAGQTAILRAIPILRRENVKFTVLNLRHAKDPDEFLVKFGADAFKEALAQAQHPTDYQLAYCKASTADEANSTVAYVNAAVSVLSGLPDPVEQDSYINKLADETGIRSETIRNQVEAAAGKPMDALLLPVMPVAPKKRAERSDFPEKLMYAYRTVLHWMSTRLTFYEAIKDVLTEDEFLHATLRTLFAIIVTKNGNVTPAELISCFEEVLEQQTVSLVFESPVRLSDDDSIIKELNQQIKEIKSSAILSKINIAIENGELELLETLKNRQKTLPDSYIT